MGGESSKSEKRWDHFDSEREQQVPQDHFHCHFRSSGEHAWLVARQLRDSGWIRGKASDTGWTRRQIDRQVEEIVDFQDLRRGHPAWILNGCGWVRRPYVA